MGYLQNYIKRDNEEKMNKKADYFLDGIIYEKEAKKINPNLKIHSYNLDKDFAGFKKGEIYAIHDTVTGRQTHLHFQTKNEAWKYISESYEAIYLSKP